MITRIKGWAGLPAVLFISQQVSTIKPRTTVYRRNKRDLSFDNMPLLP